jgi:hypothetical protein
MAIAVREGVNENRHRTSATRSVQPDSSVRFWTGNMGEDISDECAFLDDVGVQ